MTENYRVLSRNIRILDSQPPPPVWNFSCGAASRRGVCYSASATLLAILVLCCYVSHSAYLLNPEFTLVFTLVCVF